LIKYYLKIAARSALRNKLYVALSIIGLSLGLTSSLLIGLYVHDELSYDTWIPAYEEIYRANPVSGERRSNGGPSELGIWLKQDYPQLTAVSRFFNAAVVVIAEISSEVEEYNERITWADASVFEVFPLKVVYGGLEGALEEPGSVVLTREIADKYFAGSNPVGKILLFDGVNPMTVTAVIETLPSNTHLNIDLLGSSNTLFSSAAVQDRNPIQGYFGSKLWSSQTYLRIPINESVQNIEDDLDPMLDRHLPIEESRTNSEIYDIELLPVADIHLSGSNANVRRENIATVYTVGAIAVLILLTAAINYVNLMTARGTKRSSEIAIRKTVGADGNAIVSQFMTESSAYVIVSAVMAGIFAFLLLPAFNSFLVRDMAFEAVLSPEFFLTAVIVLLSTILLAGYYPALVLSRYTALNLFRTHKSISK